MGYYAQSHELRFDHITRADWDKVCHAEGVPDPEDVFEVEFDCDTGNVTSIYMEFRIYHSDDVVSILKEIAKYTDGYMDFEGEDSSRWRFRLHNGEVAEYQGKVVYPDDPYAASD